MSLLSRYRAAADSHIDGVARSRFWPTPAELLTGYRNRQRRGWFAFGGCLFWLVLIYALIAWWAFLWALWLVYTVVWCLAGGVVLLARAILGGVRKPRHRRVRKPSRFTARLEARWHARRDQS